MKFPMRHAIIPVFLLVLPILFFNCSRVPGAPIARPPNQNNGAGGVIPSGFEVFPDNSIVVNQNRELRYSPTNGEAGNYTISNLPSWATFDAMTGTIVGVPTRLTDTAQFTISKGSINYGPYQVSVIGDPLVEQQWHLFNTGQNGFALTPGLSGQDIHMRQTIAGGTLGSGVRIAVSDTGTIIDHPDLAPNILFGEARNYARPYNGSPSSWLGNPSPPQDDPGNAHGTAVSGLIAAKGWNQIGGRGVAPEAKIAPFMFLSAQDQLAQDGTIDLAFLDQFAGNFDIFNFSWGDPQCGLIEYNDSDTTLFDKIRYGATNLRGGRGAIYLIAAGNSFVESVENCSSNPALTGRFVMGNSNFSELNTTPFMINVAALNANGVAASYSTPGSANWISGTGGEFGWSVTDPSSNLSSMPALTTTDFIGCDRGIKSVFSDVSAFDSGLLGNQDCHYTSSMNGTSGATPVVAGAVALMLQANPQLTWRDVKYILAKTADVVDPTFNLQAHPVNTQNLSGHLYDLPWITNAAGFKFHNHFGFGRVNVDNAVSMAKTYSSNWGAFQTTPFRSEANTVNAVIPDGSATGLTRSLSITDSLSIEAVQLRVSISGCSGDMGVELTAPSGTRSKLLNINSMLVDPAISNHILLTNAFYGESSSGTWTLKVVDGRSPCTANLTSWSLRFFGH